MLPTVQIPEENPWLCNRNSSQRDWEGSFHLPISSFKRDRGLVLGIPLLPALPHSQVFSLKHAAPDSRGWDPEEAIKEEHLPSGDTPFLSPSCLKDGPFSRDWENETLIFWAILPGFHLPECPLHHPREMFYKDNHNLFNARHWIKCLTSMILSAPLQNGQWWRLNDPWHIKQAHVRHSKANFIDHLWLCR